MNYLNLALQLDDGLNRLNSGSHTCNDAPHKKQEKVKIEDPPWMKIYLHESHGELIGS